jgi:DNA anti-recombination protein RmuC
MAAERSGGGVARLALLVAILALAIAWAAYRREGGEVRTLWSDLTRGTDERARVVATDSDGEDFRAWLKRARERLQSRRSDVEKERNLQEVRKDVADIRENLQRTYRDASAESKERWKSMDSNLQRLQTELEEKSSKMLEELDATLEKMKREMAEEKEDGQR